MSEKLVAKCNAFCGLTERQPEEGEDMRKGVFIDTENKSRGYYCGLGKTDCIIIYITQNTVKVRK